MDEVSSNTPGNSKKRVRGKPFVKGDPRINRNGRPKSFDEARILFQEVAHEVAMQGGEPLVINGHKVTIVEAIARKWASSGNPQLQRAFIEVAFGKVPDAVDITSGGEKLKGYMIVSPDDWDRAGESQPPTDSNV